MESSTQSDLLSRVRRVCSLVFAALLVVGSAQGAAQDSGDAARGSRGYRIEIRGPIDTAVQSHLARAIKLAEADRARLVLDIDTPGGGVEVTWQMARALQNANENGVRTIAWVNERATSAGSMLSMACELLYMRPTATIGSALPVTIGINGMQPTSTDEQIREKELSYCREEFRVIAEKSGRSGLLAEAMVDPDIEVVLLEVDGVRTLASSTEYNDMRQRGEVPRFLRTVVSREKLLNVGGEEALDLGLADGLVDSLDELASFVGLEPAELVLVPRTRSEDVAGLLSVWTPLLLILAFVLAYVEMKIPGFGVAGILSVVCFGLVLFGRYLVGLADVPHVILMAVGVALIAAELFLFPGTIWAGALGALSLMIGIVWSFAGIGTGFEYALDREILLDQALRVMGAAVVAMIATWSLSRFLPRTPMFSRLVLDAGGDRVASAAMPEASGAHARVAIVGATGRSLTALRPVGKVVLVADPDIDFEARSSGGEIGRGCAIRVVEVQPSGRLVVEEDSSA